MNNSNAFKKLGGSTFTLPDRHLVDRHSLKTEEERLPNQATLPKRMFISKGNRRPMSLQGSLNGGRRRQCRQTIPLTLPYLVVEVMHQSREHFGHR